MNQTPNRYLARAAAAAFAATLAHAAPAAARAELASNPSLPQYGQAVAVELRNASSPTFLPGTRYTRTGSTITIDYEYLTADGFGPFSPDFGLAPLPLGELAPGNYQVRARLHDLENPSTPPIELSMQLAVVPPEQWGIYTLPLAPQAFSATEVIIRSAAYFDPASMRARVSGNVVRVEFDYQEDAPAGGTAPPGMRTYASVPISNLAPGAYRVEGWGRPHRSAPYEQFFARAFNVAPTVPVIEFYAESTGHYFMTAKADEVALLDRGDLGWQRTGQGFVAWLRQSDAPAGALPVCRFYASGPNSHFYGGPQDCDYLKALEVQQRAEAAARGVPFSGWGYEAIAFWALLPQEGRCSSGTPVYRAYNDRFAQMDSNHRFMTEAGQREAMSVGWVDEGTHFCSAS